ncbi:MAG: hypothetical protein OEZ04_02745 [Nitrospinota bacterium]|nr:hypothetical protein [Nitrospinota bacterium]
MKQVMKLLLTGGLAVYTVGIFLVHENFTRRVAAVNGAVVEIENEIAEYKDQQKRKVGKMVEKRASKLEECLAFQPTDEPVDTPAEKPTWRERWFKRGEKETQTEVDSTETDPAQGDRQ